MYYSGHGVSWFTISGASCHACQIANHTGFKASTPFDFVIGLAAIVQHTSDD
jgi:hypothetical protein